MFNKYFPVLVVGLILIVSCRKIPVDPGTEPPPPSASSELQLIADSVYLFSREIYFWNEIRTAAYDYDRFKPRDSVKTDAIETAKAVLAKVRSTNATDKDKEFSYATRYDEAAETSTAAQTINDYGFYFKAGYSDRKIHPTLYIDDPQFSGWYVTYVYKNSDAGKKGVERGMKIISVNGTNINRLNQASVNVLNNMFYHETIKSADIVFQRPNGTNLSVNVAITTFAPNSVLYRDTINTGTHRKLGYLVYNFFGKYADTKADIDEAIQYFKNKGVNEVVVDLRYNRGGYTQTQNYLSNNYAPSNVTTNNVMYKMHYNSNLQNGDYTMMRKRHAYDKDYYTVARNTINFSPANSFGNTKLYVIVGRSTASASELFINNLMPWYNNNLIIIGDANTYGKPVGFFPIDLFKKVTFWTVSFETKNSSNGSVPYTGFGPNFRIYDGVDKIWGDKSEENLKAAIDLIDGKQRHTLIFWGEVYICG